MGGITVKNEVIALLQAALDDALAVIELEREAARLAGEIAERRHLREQFEVLEKAHGKLAQARLERKAGKMADGQAVLNQLHDIFGDLGLTVRSTPSPSVTKFLTDTYEQEKRLQDDSHRHVKSYVTLLARVNGDKPLNTYKRADVIAWGQNP